MTSRLDHIEAIDIARAVAIISVVYIHSSSLYLSDLYHPALNRMLFASRFAVPLFILISGYFHKPREKGEPPSVYHKNFIANRIRRLLLPYLFFATLYMLIRVLLENIPVFSSFVPVKYNSLIRIIYAILFVQDNPAGHLYFLPLLFLVSVLFGMVCDLVRLSYLLAAVCIAASLMAYCLHGGIYLSLNPIKGIGFYALGFFIRRNLHDAGAGQATALLFAMATLIYLALAIFNPPMNNFSAPTKFGVLFAYHLMGALAVFQLCFYFAAIRPFPKLKSFLAFIGKYSYGIFLWHEPYIVSAAYILLMRFSLNHPLFNQLLLLTIGIFIPILGLRYFWAPIRMFIARRQPFRLSI